MLQPMLNAVYKHIACSEELLCSQQFHSDCLAFDQLGLLFLFQAGLCCTALLGAPEVCSGDPSPGQELLASPRCCGTRLVQVPQFAAAGWDAD